MKRRRLILCTALAVASLIIFQAQADTLSPSADKNTWLADKVKVNGYMYYNVTHSGVQGEKYLLNQELSTAKLFTDVQLTEWSKLHSLLVYNSRPSSVYPRFYLDEFYLQLKQPELTQWYAIVGEQWLPYGLYNTDLIYKPVTKALSQTNENAIRVGYDDSYYANAALFRPHTRIRSSSLPLYYNINLGMHENKEPFEYDVGISYLYSIAESDLFQYNGGFGGFLYHPIDSHVPGAAVYGNFKYKKFSTYMGYASALTSFKANELSYQGKPATPIAINIQEGYDFLVKQTPAKIIMFYDKTFQALALRLPKERLGLGLNVYPKSYLDIQFQYSKEYNYGSNVSASGLNKNINGSSKPTNLLAMQLTLHF